MNRRTFLTLTAIAAATTVTGAPRTRATLAAAPALDRTSKWKPSSRQPLAVEWRYIAGRITAEASDFGFIVALSDTKFPSEAQELLVERQNFSGDQAFATHPYIGTLTYDKASATYTFQDSQSPVNATWQWDAGASVYRLNVVSPELTLQNVVLRPQCDLIPEGGNGIITIAPILGLPIGSDYYADWVVIEVDTAEMGVARVDIQALYPVFTAQNSLLAATPSADYDHHWFAVAGQSAGAPIWISAWRMEAQDGPRWDVTIARSVGTGTPAASTTELSGAAFPLSVRPVAWQPLPSTAAAAASGQRTGSAWHLSAGMIQPGDLIDLEIVVPPGQFAPSARLGLIQGLDWMEEGIGTSATGTVQRNPLTGVRLVVAETTAEFSLRQIPLVLR